MGKDTNIYSLSNSDEAPLNLSTEMWINFFSLKMDTG